MKVIIAFLPFLIASCVSYGNLIESKLLLDDGFVNYYLLPGKDNKKANQLIIYLNGSISSSALGEKSTFVWTGAAEGV